MPAEKIPQPNQDKVNQGLVSLPFGDMIGAPLAACVDAQEQAAISTVNFIRRVGFAEKEPDKVVNVTFRYTREGKSVELTVPLLTIVPIPYIAIDNVNISFKANITGFEEEHQSDSDLQCRSENTNSAINYYGFGWFNANNRRTIMRSSLSTKKDSVSSQDSNYCIEATIDVQVQAKQESMPAGMAKVLEMLNQAITLHDPAPTTTNS
jgi:hypothetical protein